MTNNEMLMAAIEFEEPEFACDLLYLIQMGIVDPNEEFNVYGEKWNLVDRKVSGEYIKNNLLGFNIVRIFCVRINVEDYEIILARNEVEARSYCLSKYGFIPKLVEMDKSKYLKEFYFEDSKEYKSLMDIRRENDIFPRTALII
mgnify:FL=1